MANICYNEFWIFGENEDTLNKVNNKFNKLFEESLYGEITYVDEGVIEGYFDSKWTFPIHLFENFFDEFDDDTLYMRCLSTEWGCHYIALNIYEDKVWKNEQSFDF